MTNFTTCIKRDLLSLKTYNKNRACGVASLSAFMRVSGCLSFTQEGLGFVLGTSMERVAERYLELTDKLFSVTCTLNVAEDRINKNERINLSYNGEAAYDMLIALGIFERNEEGNYELYYGIPARILPDDDCKIAYIRGAFLGCGSCTLPRDGKKTGYHLEFVFSREETATDFVALLGEYELLAKIVKRKESFVVYFASLGAISDFLSVVGAEGSLSRLVEAAEEREESNHGNRVNNCFVGNMDRTATAAANQCLAIRHLRESGALNLLDEGTRQVAEARLAAPEASLKELSEKLRLTKSCVSHRMRKIIELYEDIQREQQEKNEEK